MKALKIPAKGKVTFVEEDATQFSLEFMQKQVGGVHRAGLLAGAVGDALQ